VERDDDGHVETVGSDEGVLRVLVVLVLAYLLVAGVMVMQ